MLGPILLILSVVFFSSVIPVFFLYDGNSLLLRIGMFLAWLPVALVVCASMMKTTTGKESISRFLVGPGMFISPLMFYTLESSQITLFLVIALCYVASILVFSIKLFQQLRKFDSVPTKAY